MGSTQRNNVAAVSGAHDPDPAETREWLDALESVVRAKGSERARYVLNRLEAQGQQLGLIPQPQPFSAYRNTIPLERQKPYPGDLAMEERITAIVRWNALAMVMRANAAHGDLGGHIASYASAAEIFEVGFNHFFRAADENHGGDLVFFQPHSAPGIYARAFLEGRLSEDQLNNYRQELTGNGLCSYPHPWLMPDFWQFPTGSMGIGPISAIYQARFLRYLRDRGLQKADEVPERHVWGVFGDGEMDEPESIAALTLAVRENLDNVTFVINCNLQRLDGPVRGNGQVIQEFEALFTGAGWNVIKVLWGSDWDALFGLDHTHILLKTFAATVDGKYQALGAMDGLYNAEHFFGQDPELKALVAHMSDSEIDALRRGGHDLRKLHAAFAAAQANKGRPTVILAKTKKGFGMGAAGESRNTSHQAKKLDASALLAFRDRFSLPFSDDDAKSLTFYRPDEDSAELRYLRERRAALGGSLPRRRRVAPVVTVPAIETYAQFVLAPEGREMSTTMAAVRMFSALLKDKILGPRIVPIVADEARTFGMSTLFRQVGIYSPIGQLYEPEDAGSMLYYHEAKDGQLLEEGITEAGAISSWVAAATSYSVNGLPMLPFYIYYSMFGFQRVGDLIWAAADQRSRGFLFGATAGRTTLGGEGLQHQDGSSHMAAATVPNCRAYDPCFACELAVILDHGMRAMMEQQRDEFYYVTLMNETYAQPDLPADAAGDIIRGLYRFRAAPKAKIRLIGSGAILREVIAAADLLLEDWGVAAEIWSATSFTELDREARDVARWNRLHPAETPHTSHVQDCLAGPAPVIAATDYVRAYPQLIATHVSAQMVTLGTDGFGRSDTRARLRRFFEIDRHQIVLASLDALARSGDISRDKPLAAITKYGIDPDAPPPWTV